jgi:hypothetical protein
MAARGAVTDGLLIRTVSLVVALAKGVTGCRAGDRFLPVKGGTMAGCFGIHTHSAQSPTERAELASPGLDRSVRLEQPGELADIMRFRVIVKSPVEPAGSESRRGFDRTSAPAGLLFFRRRRMSPAVKSWFGATIPAELGDYDRFARARHFADDASR